MLSTTSSQAQFFRELRSLLRAPYPLIHLETFEENRALSLLRRLAEADERTVREWSPVTGFDGEALEDGEEAFWEAIRRIESSSNGDIYVFKDVHSILNDNPRARRRLREIAAPSAASQKTLVFVGPVRLRGIELRKELTRIEMPLPGREVIRRECDIVFSKESFPDVDREALVSGAMGLTGREAHRAFHRVRQQYQEAVQRNAVFDAEQAMLSEKQRMIGDSEVLDFHRLEAGLDDVGGMENLKRWLEEREAAFGDKARTYGLPMPKGLLLIGVQGCGKSLTAKAIARHWGLPLLRLDLGTVFDGRRSAEEALRHAIRSCEAIAPCVLWIDEIEKGFAGDSEGRSQRVLGSLLTWQQEKSEPVFLTATANHVHKLPPELMRKGRFDEIFFVDLPDLHERREILEIHLARRGRPFSGDVVQEIAAKAEYFSGAELEEVVISAMYTAFADDRDVEAEDLNYACQEIVPLYRTYEEEIKALREWAHDRARPASHERAVLDFFE